ncbi:type VI secretion protein [Pseudomonas sp. PIC25]|uniref:type VI secretion system baseplate subunit TssE n=1 Tax=Pseudomonas sp. PIC25 TaxID=1958773 RepID=UPI000BAB2F43|nr:type VI secretion system baseplate subunit TssE [Pseudomonas sp. PIC25]PAU65829.1 type VI secretion protein [Pseudomonas sp. PIC25]
MAVYEAGSQPPLFERLASDDEEHPAPPVFDRHALAESVRNELRRLLNTRRATRRRLPQLSIIDYGIPDWSALHGERSDDRRLLAREIRDAIARFEPRLSLDTVEATPTPEQPRKLTIRLTGSLREGNRRWPVAFVIDPADDGLEVRHERFD